LGQCLNGFIAFFTKKRKDYLMSDNTQTTRQGLPSLPKSTIWMLSFGFLGVQTAFTLQSSQMSRIFQTLGADPHSLGWFFILPPLAGMLVFMMLIRRLPPTAQLMVPLVGIIFGGVIEAVGTVLA